MKTFILNEMHDWRYVSKAVHYPSLTSQLKGERAAAEDTMPHTKRGQRSRQNGRSGRPRTSMRGDNSHNRPPTNSGMCHGVCTTFY